MRKEGDIFFLAWNNQYYGQKCKITKINKRKDETSYDIELLEPQDGWLKDEGERIFHFTDVHYCDLKEQL